MRVAAAFFALLLVAGAAMAAPFAYVPNEGSATVSVIDTANDRVMKTIATGGKALMRADVDFSISENPNFRFYLVPGDGGELQAKIVDNQDLAFETSVRLDAAHAAASLAQ